MIDTLPKAHRRFGVRHPLPILRNAGVIGRDFSQEAARKADEQARTAFVALGSLAVMFGASVGSPNGSGFAVTYQGFSIFYEVA